MKLVYRSEIKLKNKAPVMSLDLDRSGAVVAIAQKGDHKGNPSLVLWDLDTERVIDILANKPFDYINAVCLSNNWLAYVEDGEWLHLTNRSNRELRDQVIKANDIAGISCPKTTDLMLVESTKVELWDIAAQRILWRWPAFDGINSPSEIDVKADITTDSQHIVAGGVGDGKIYIYQRSDFRLITTIETGLAKVKLLRTSPRLGLIGVIGEYSRGIGIWKAANGERLLGRVLSNENMGKWTLDFSCNLDLVAVGTKYGFVSVTDIFDEQRNCMDHGHSGCVNDVRFSPNEDLLFSGGEDGVVKIYEVDHA